MGWMAAVLAAVPVVVAVALVRPMLVLASCGL
jgi:hypothetical protein